MANFFPGAQLPVSEIRLTTAQWSDCGATYTPPLAVLCIDTDTSLAKMGNGSDFYNDLGYFNSGGGTSTTNVIPKGAADNTFGDSSITDDGTTVTATEPIITAHATTPYFETATGKTNTGYVNVKGKTSGSLKITTADATAQIVTVSAAAQTTGASTLTIPDQGGTSRNFVFDTLTQTLTNKTLTAPVIGVATGTSLAVTGLLTSSSPTAGIGYATGAGGAVTQSTDKSTTVVSNTLTTAITLNNAALNAGVTVGFTFTNSSIAATDTVICTHQSAGTSGAYTVNAFPGAGSAVVSVRNNTAGNLSEAIVLRITVIKSVSA